MANLITSPETPVSSPKLKSVFLQEWWLVEVEGGSKLGVGGYSNAEMVGARALGSPRTVERSKTMNGNSKRLPMRVFCSAAIAKRHNDNILETVDGIMIAIRGCINRSRSQQNGFPIEVCNHFCSGFPYYWEEFASKSPYKKLVDASIPSLPASFIGLPVTEVRDTLMSTTGESEACALTSIIFRDILKQCGGESSDHSSPTVISDEEFKQNQFYGDFLSDATWMKPEVSSTPKPNRNYEVSGSTLVKDVMNSFRRSQKKATRVAQKIYPFSVDSDEQIDSTETYQKSPVKHYDPYPPRKTSEDSFHRMHAVRIDFKKCKTEVISGEKRKAEDSLEEFSPRRSGRLKKSN